MGSQRKELEAKAKALINTMFSLLSLLFARQAIGKIVTEMKKTEL